MFPHTFFFLFFPEIIAFLECVIYLVYCITSAKQSAKTLSPLVCLVQHTEKEIQNMPPQDLLLWHIDYFELKVLEK